MRALCGSSAFISGDQGSSRYSSLRSPWEWVGNAAVDFPLWAGRAVAHLFKMERLRPVERALAKDRRDVLLLRMMLGCSWRPRRRMLFSKPGMAATDGGLVVVVYPGEGNVASGLVVWIT